MKLTVLGRYGPYPAPGGRCSGYLVETDSACVVLDLGAGAMGSLMRVRPGLDFDALLLSHLHSDHMADALVLRYALQQYGKRGAVELPLPLVLPQSPGAVYGLLSAEEAYRPIPAADGKELSFGDMEVTLHTVRHPVEAYAFRLRSGGKTLAYTGDTRFFPQLAEVCRNADLLLADACFLEQDQRMSEPPHMTAAEAGKLAAAAGAKRLLLTHIWGGGDSDGEVLSEAAAHFPAAEVAEELGSYIL